MQLVSFDSVRLRIAPGEPCPGDVRNVAGELLLARGQLVTSAEMAQALQERGAFIDLSSEPGPASARDEPSAEDGLFGRWVSLEARIGGLLRSSHEKHFLPRLNDAVMRVAATAHKHSDELVYLILRHDHTRLHNYGVAHALHCAALCALLTRRLGWSGSSSTSLVGAALTMNIAILDLQGELAASGLKPTPEQWAEIQAHPEAAGAMLRRAGLADPDWLQTVEQHHEVSGGEGYARKLDRPSEMSQLLRLVDIFAAKHSPRTGRGPLPAHQAARDLFLQSKSDPFANVLIKELGIYPPGCYVRLAGGEIAVVTHVGATARTPLVAVVVNRSGDVLLEPVRRDTAQKQYEIVKTVPDGSVKVNVPADRLYASRPAYA